MPFLPSEAEESKLLLQQQMKDVLIFHYLPILWYRYPIPNEIREYWYNERPEILDYMQKAYQDLDIQFLPDSVVQQLNQQKLTGELPQIYNSFQSHSWSEMVSTQLLSKTTEISGDASILYLHLIHDHFNNLDKFF